jgi:hypothetical protein
MNFVFIFLLLFTISSIQSSRNSRIIRQFHELVYINSYANTPEINLVNFMEELVHFYSNDPVGLATLVRDHWNYSLKAMFLKFFGRDRKMHLIDAKQLPFDPFNAKSLQNMTFDLCAIIRDLLCEMAPGNNEVAIETIKVLMELAMDIKNRLQRIRTEFAGSVVSDIEECLTIWRFLIENLKFEDSKIDFPKFLALYAELQEIVRTNANFNDLPVLQMAKFILFRMYCVMIYSKGNVSLFLHPHPLLISYFVELVHFYAKSITDVNFLMIDAHVVYIKFHRFFVESDTKTQISQIREYLKNSTVLQVNEWDAHQVRDLRRYLLVNQKSQEKITFNKK